MNKLSTRTQELLSEGARTTGSFVEGYHYVEEQLYINQADEIYKFCEYLDNVIGGGGRANMKGLFLAFKYPNNAQHQAFAEATKQRIAEIKNISK